MKPGRIVVLIIGCVVVVSGIGMLLGGGAVGLAYAFGRDDEGYFAAGPDRLASSTVAVTAGDLTFAAEPGSPDWIIDAIDADVRLRVTSESRAREVFVGIARSVDVDRYLAGTAHDELRRVGQGDDPEYRRRDGDDEIRPPTEETFWVATAAGPGEQRLDWEATGGRWAAVLMNADGSPGVAADVEVGVKAGIVLPVALGLLGLGLVATALGVVLIVVATAGREHPAGPPPLPGETTTEPAAPAAPGEALSPVTLRASLDPELSRWLWLVKWFLAIPHFIVLTFLWIAFAVLTVVAGVAVLFTGTYPRGIFEFNRGVLRWSWRVSYYATTGGLGTDRYPPFSLEAESDYPATLEVAYPSGLSRGLVLVKWWLLALPHYVIVWLLIGGTIPSISWHDDGPSFDLFGGGGVLALLVLVAGVLLLVNGTYTRSLFDLIVGLNRWIYRVIAYAALMTDEYPPFRLDQGGDEPTAHID